MPSDAKTRRDVRWTGLSPAERRTRRRALLLDAAFDLLGTEGWGGTTVRAVCTRAELNPRYFYESFDDLDQLVIAVYDRIVEELAREVLEAQRRAPDRPRARARAAVERIVGFIDEDRRRGRVLYVEALGNERLNRRRLETGHLLVGAVEKSAVDRGGPLPAGEQIGRIGAAMLVGGMTEVLVEWLEGRVSVDRSQLVDDLTELALALGAATATIVRRRGGTDRTSNPTRRSS